MKKLFELLFLLFIFVLVVNYRNEIHTFIMDNVVYRKEPFETQPNNYTLDYAIYHKIDDEVDYSASELNIDLDIDLDKYKSKLR